MNKHQHQLQTERLGLSLHNEGLDLGKQIMAIIRQQPILALFPEAFGLMGHPITINAACRYVGCELHRIAESN